MVAGTIVLPATTASAVGDLKSWKFDFGSAEGTAESGYTLVTPESNYTTDAALGYGFIGNNENDFKLDGGRADGFVQQQGQKIELEAGGTTGLNDGIGVTGEDSSGNQADKYYPTRFAIKVEDDTYYKVKATVTTLDSSQPATASLYTERKHPLYTGKTIEAGTTVTTEWTVRPTPIYYEKSDPTGNRKDEMVNIALLGENTALAALEVEQIETAPVLWILGDSTVTDGPGTLPFWPLQNYTGVGTGVTKYLPSNIAMVNEGEGGLNANDNNHFNMVKDRIKAGDFLWVEYGHNHKNASGIKDEEKRTGEYWTNDYLQALKKYYDACKTPAGGGTGTATLVVVGPIDRINNYDSASNTWSTSLSQFSTVGKQYVDALKYGGEAKATEFLTKWKEVSDLAEAHKTAGVVNSDTREAVDALIAEANKIITGLGTETTEIENVAFVDLNKPSLDWYGTITEGATVNGAAVTNEKRLINFYFQTARGGNTDTTHPNDAGAENLAYQFFATANKTEYPALAPLLTRMEAEAENPAEKPTPISEDIINAGYAPNSTWPAYQYIEYAYPTIIKDIKVGEDKKIGDATVYVQDTVLGYAVCILEVLDADGAVVGEKHVFTPHIDGSSTTPGTTVTLSLGENAPTLEDGQSFRAYMWPVDMATMEPLTEEEGGKYYSSIYTPTDIEKLLITNEDGDGIEDFDYFGANYEGGEGGTKLTDKNEWIDRGSGGKTLTLGQNGDTKYANIVTDGIKTQNNQQLANQGSFYISKELEEEIGTSGKYIISMDMKYISGGGLNIGFVVGNTTNNPWGSETLRAYTVNNDGKINSNGQDVGQISGGSFTNVTYILDMDYGTASISVAGADPTTYKVANYDTTSTDINPKKLTSFMFDSNRVAVGIQVANLTVAKLKSSKLPDKTLTVVSNNDAHGTAEIQKDGVTVEYDTPAAPTEPEGDITLSYKDGNAVVTSKAALDAVLIEAVYEGTTLKSVKPTDVSLTEAGSKTVAAAEGSTLMLWNALAGDDAMEPLTDAITAEETPVGKSYTAELNTVITAKATAADGYVFVNWTDGGTVVSSDAEYTFRLRDTSTLKANFAKQHDASDTANFKVAADKQLIKAGTEQKVTFTVSDIVDSDGNAVVYKDTDITATADGVTVGEATDAKIEVTIPANFEIAANTAVDLPVKFKVGSKEVTYNIGVYSYGFYENVKNGKLTAEYDGSTDTINGKDAICFSLNGTNTITLPSAVTIGDNTVITFKASHLNGCGQIRTISICDSNGTSIITEALALSWGTLNVGGSKKDSSTWQNAVGTLANAAPAGSWADDITITLNHTAGTGTVALGENSVPVTLTGADIASIKLQAESGAGSDRMLGITDLIIK